MLQAHSLLWNYLWVAPNALLLILGLLLWRRGLSRQIPAFFAFAVLGSIGQFSVFISDITPSVSPLTFWYVDCSNLSVESILKFLVIGAVFGRVFNPYPSVSSLGKILVSAVGAVLVFVATLTAAFSHGDSPVRLLAGAHLLEMSSFIVECGLILFIFLFAAYFRMHWDRMSFGILLGLGFSACEHLATWSIITNADPSAHHRILIDFLNMATYHVCVLIWYYYLLVPEKKRAGSQPPTDYSNDPPSDPPSSSSEGSPQDHEEALKDWNRELERLIHQ